MGISLKSKQGERIKFQSAKPRKERNRYIMKLVEDVGATLHLSLEEIKKAKKLFFKIVRSQKNIVNYTALSSYCIYAALDLATPVGIQQISMEYQKRKHRVSPRMIMNYGSKYNPQHCYHHRDVVEVGSYMSHFLPCILTFPKNYTRIITKCACGGEKASKTYEKYQNLLMDQINQIRPRIPLILFRKNPTVCTVTLIYGAACKVAINTGKKAILIQKNVAQATGQILPHQIRDFYCLFLKPIIFSEQEGEEEEEEENQ